MRRLCTSKATVERLGAYSGNKATFSAVSGDIRGYFQPIDSDKNIIALGIEGQAYQFVTNGYEDIQTKDRLTISGAVYYVRGVQRFTAGKIDELRVILEQQVSE